MDVIPVIDLMGGEVVHARRGERDAYRPIESKLVFGSGPLTIVGALMELAPFRRLYVADIDAIRGGRGHDAAVMAIAAAHPDVEIWADRGETDVETLAERRADGETSVIGTESFEDARTLAQALKASGGVLSLDHDAAGPVGPDGAHDDPSLWPRRVIVMTLARVGAGEGPDMGRLADVVGKAGGRAVYAAGGVRGLEDLEALRQIGVAGALVASALHDGRLTPEAIRDLLRA
ncbi:HisA/HisF-related TIM barrel protein [Chelatococcus sambhunathii]|uniref:HisA/HisF-related TIM barrel protein n=1 Tax=Chelatococcus sambhunathii TaxID=363953 RepID=UPI002852B7E3|nr:HisA/HisF-related TIM barrel protein [Chelatococcus sambhunathii]